MNNSLNWVFLNVSDENELWSFLNNRILETQAQIFILSVGWGLCVLFLILEASQISLMINLILEPLI